MCFFFYFVDGRSIVKLMGSIYALIFSFDVFRWIVDREVDGPGVDGLKSLLRPLCAVLGRSWGLCWRSGGSLGTYVGDLELLLGLYGRSWAALGASIGGLGCTWAALGAYVGDLGPLLGLYSRSWSALGAAVCGPVPLLEPILAVLAALGGYLGGLGPLLRPMWAVWG